MTAAELVRKAALASDPGERLALLLDAWRAAPVSALRERVVEASRLCQGDGVPRSPRMDRGEWDALEKERNPVDLPRLVAAVAVEPPPEAARRLELLAGWPADPRRVDAIAEWIAHAPIQTASADSKRFWKVALDVFAGSGDAALPRILAGLDPGGSSTTVLFLRRQMVKIYSSLCGKRLTWAAWRGALPPVAEPAVDSDLAAALVQLDPHLGRDATGARHAVEDAAAKERELLEAIYARPDDDEPRLVYADWLQQRGDPWGELVVLQVADARGNGTDASRKRIAVLLKEHAEARYAGIPVLWKQRFGGSLRPARVERGFALEGEIWRPLAKDPAREDHRWGTFERLRFEAFGADDVLGYAADPAMKSLRAILNLPPGAAVGLLERRPARMDEVGLGAGDQAAEAAARLAEASWLKTLRFDGEPTAHPALLRAAFDGSFARVPRVVLTTRAWARPELWTIHVEHDGGSATLHVELHQRPSAPAIETLKQVLAMAPSAAPRTLSASFPVAAKSRGALLAQVFGAAANEARFV